MRCVIVLALCLAVVGCGSGDSDGTRSRAQFVASVDRACAATSRATRPLGTPNTPDKLVRFADATARGFAGIRHAIGEGLPAGRDRAGAEAYSHSVDELQPIVSRMQSSARQLQGAVRRRDQAAFTKARTQTLLAARQLKDKGAAADRVAHRYRMPVCGRISG